MKIALMNEFSQAGKNPIILKELEEVASEQNHSVFNVGMSDDNDHYLTYIHLGIIASLLLNSKAVDFVVSGCGTGQGALMSLNAHRSEERRVGKERTPRWRADGSRA